MQEREIVEILSRAESSVRGTSLITLYIPQNYNL